MKFFHRVVHSFEDTTRNFEQLEANNILDRRIVGGSVTVTFPAATTRSGTVTVTHGLTSNGLPVKPVSVSLTANDTGVAGLVLQPGFASVGTTTFVVGCNSNVAITGSQTIDWIAIA